LGEITDFTGGDDFAGGGLTLTCEDLGHCCFAGTVSANQADLVALLNSEVHP
jgi:hypothetical protein